jgi:uncharacterized Tic20 family protein
MSAADELNKLKKLHDDRTITDEQYERAKAKLLDEEEARGEDEDEREERRPRRRRDRAEDDDEEDEYALRRRRARRKKVREWCMILHLSLLAGHVVALGGIIAPIVIWQAKKDEMPELDEHGKNAMNWLITWVLYMAVSLVLAFVVVGIPLLIVGGVLGVVFPILAAVKANEGQVWKYPLAIPFLK